MSARELTANNRTWLWPVCSEKGLIGKILVSSKIVKDCNLTQMLCIWEYNQNHITKLVLCRHCCCCHLVSDITASTVDTVGAIPWLPLWMWLTMLSLKTRHCYHNHHKHRCSLSSYLQNLLLIQSPWFESKAYAHVLRRPGKQVPNILCFCSE